MGEKEEFLSAVEEDEYAEYEIDEDIVLVTDHEFGDGFYPYLILPPGEHDTEELAEMVDEEFRDHFVVDTIELERNTSGEFVIGHILLRNEGWVIPDGA